MLRLIFLSFTLFCFSFIGAAPTNFNTGTPALEDVNCNLPAPSTLNIPVVTANSLTAQWSAVAGAVAYDVTVEDAVTQALYYSSTVTGLSEVCTSLPPATDVVVKVAAVCSSGTSTNYAEATATTDFVIELIVNNYQSCPNSSWNTVGTTPVFEFDAQSGVNYEGQILDPVRGVSHQFSFVVGTVVDNNATVSMSESIGDIEYAMPPQGPSTAYGQVKFMNQATVQAFLKFNASGAANGWAKGYVTSLYPGLEFKLRGCSPKGNTRGERELITETAPAHDLVANPNPFQEILQVSMNVGEESSDLQVELMNLNGQIVKTMIYSNIQGEFIDNLSTSDLPTGTYLLRARTQNQVQSQLVIKSN